jgi:hypothetical protein
MIAMLVGHQDAVQRVWIFAELTHTAGNFPGAKTGIDQHTGAISDEQYCVAG